jgi:hypothetical protein
MKRAYVEHRFGPAATALIGTCNEIVAEYQAQGLRLTLRQLYYQLVSRDVIPNLQKQYDRLGNILSDARLAGMVDWSAIEDRIRVPEIPPEWSSIENIVEAAIDSFRLPRWKNQANYVELWVEKDALAGVLSPIASEHHIPLMVNRGYSSTSAMYESARRLHRFAHRDAYILYLGDHDPSGEDMVRDIRDRLRIFKVYPEVEKIALTTEQVEKYNPPENPVKMGDSRSPGYVALHGHRCWEVDALPPTVLRDLIVSRMEDLVDMEAMEEVKAEEQRQVGRLREKLAEMQEES